MPKIGQLVIMQETQISDNVVTFHETPGVVTYIGKRQKKDVAPLWGKDEGKGEDLVDVVSLTLFPKGSIQFIDNVVEYSDDAGQMAGIRSYRESGSAAPQVKLKTEEEKAKAKPGPEPDPEGAPKPPLPRPSFTPPSRA